MMLDENLGNGDGDDAGDADDADDDNDYEEV